MPVSYTHLDVYKRQAVGTAIGVACVPKKRHPMKKKAQHAMKLVANCVEDLSAAMGM